MWPGGKRTVETSREQALEEARGRGGGRAGVLATFISAIALLFSGYSFYEAVLRSPELAIYVPPRMAYTDPDRPDSPFEVFIIPVTLANDGARSGTVLSIDLDVTNPRTGKSKRFYAPDRNMGRAACEAFRAHFATRQGIVFAIRAVFPSGERSFAACARPGGWAL